VALCLYTSGGCYEKINAALRESKRSISILKHAVFTTCFIRGFRLLPSYWGGCYRGGVIEIKDYQVGKIVVWRAFTSTSKKIESAKKFIKIEKISQTMCPVLFTIQSKSGRCLSDISLYQNEEEVVFRSFTSFKIEKMELKPTVLAGQIIQVYHIGLIEAYPDIRGRKVLVWIDDRLKDFDEFHYIMDACERDGVTCVHLHSTKEANEFFTSHPSLLEREITALRIITDMARKEEDKKENIEAGLDLVKLLLQDFKYDRTIVCYTGPTYLEANRVKFQQNNLHNVFVTANRQEAEQWARFKTIPNKEKKGDT